MNANEQKSSKPNTKQELQDDFKRPFHNPQRI
jgi:hypothetical protein